MDWLMGKARGVSKGLMNASSSVNTTSPTEAVSAYQSPPSSACLQSTLLSSSPHTPIPEELRTGFIASKDILVPDGGRSASPVNKLSVSVNNQSTAAVSAQRNSPLSKPSPNFSKSGSVHVDPADSGSLPVFSQEHYVRQQLPLSGESTLFDFTDLVEPFPAMDTNEWLAAHTIALFENLSTIFDAIHELCTCPHPVLPQTGSVSSHSPVEALDDDRGKKSKLVGASHHHHTPSSTINSDRQMIDSALSSCHDLIQSARIFPVRNGEPFPNDLPVYVTSICKNLLMCIIHIYLFHFYHLEQLDLISYMNTLAKHFFAFTLRFSLIEEKHFDPLFGFHRVLLSTNPPVPSNPITSSS
ncbi:Mps one binder kinase activator 2 [Fasciolopsis buskii]|uniref:Mps one binder kinase activator 2 n=1 Tax=Fasciolopsis buskii TaxID=27845 RepID=A0A8E0VHI1_9TREM|nr:Mps one binder kinase activator 2 [Fasciolopsis buski]